MNSEIERLAKKAGLETFHSMGGWDAHLEEFSALVAEACAKEADSVSADFGGVAAGPFVTDLGKHTHNSMAAGATNAAAAIRAKFALIVDKV